MADAEATIRVNVEGAEQVEALAAALDSLAGKAGESVSAAGGAFEDLQRTAMGSMDDFWKGMALGMTDELGKIQNEFRQQFQGAGEEVKKGAASGGKSMSSAAAEFGIFAGIASAGMNQLIGAAKSLASSIDPIGQSFQAASDSAQRTLKGYREAQRAGIGLEQAQSKLTAAQFLGVDNYGQMAERLSKAITPEKVGGKKTADAFKQIGITPQYLDKLAKAGERVDPFGFIEQAGAQWDKLHDKLGSAKTAKQIEAANTQISKFQDSMAKILPRNMAAQVMDLIRTTTPQERARYRQTGEDIEQRFQPGVAAEQQVQSAKEFNYQLTALGAQTEAAWASYGTQTRGAIAGFLENVNTSFGEIAPSFVGAASTLSNKIWTTLSDAMGQIDLTPMSRAFDTLKQSMEEVDTTPMSDALGELGTAFSDIGVDAIKESATAIKEIATAFKELKGFGDGLADGLNSVQEQMTGFATQMREGIGNALQGIADKLPTWAQKLLGIGDAAEEAGEKQKSFGQKVREAIPGMEDGINAVKNQVSDWQETRQKLLAGEKIEPAAVAAAPEVAPPAVEAAAPEVAAPIAEAITGAAAEAGPTMGEGITSAAQQVGSTISESVAGVGESISSSISGAMEQVSGIGETISSSLSGAMESVAGIGESIGGSISGAMEQVSGIGESIGSSIQGAVSGIGDAVAGGASQIQAAAAGIGPAIASGAGQISAAASGIGGAIQAAAGSLAAAAASIPRTISVVGLPGGASAGGAGGGAPTGGSSP